MRLPDPEIMIARLLVFVIAITVHEFMHAWSANALGDSTARNQGRITLNPVAHFDPLGFLFSLLLVFGLAPIAWGKPVPVNPYALQGGRRGMAIVAFAGPLSNLVLAAVAALPLWVVSATGEQLPDLLLLFIGQMIFINVALFSFNLIPIPPLDGFNILVGIVPNYWVPILEPIRQYAFIILLLVIFLPGNLLGVVLGPVQSTLLELLIPARF